MRQAFSDIGWITSTSSTCAGLALGYDWCAEHEWGVDGLLAKFGVKQSKAPSGIEDFLITKVPETMQFLEYAAKYKDKRRKGYLAALLVVSSRQNSEGFDPQEFAQRYGLDFIPPCPQESLNRDVRCAWSKGELAVHVRGAGNIQRLKELHEAILRKDLALGVPGAKVFSRAGLSLVVYSLISEEEKQTVAAKYAAHNELEAAMCGCGIRDKLQKADKRFYALSPAWVDDTKTQLCFFLNPAQQDKYQHGWFTLEELEAWAQDKGPVLFDRELSNYEKLPESHNWHYRLLKGLESQGLSLRWGAKMCWLDKPGGMVGLRIIAHSSCGERLQSGIYPFTQFMSQHALPLDTPQEQAA